MGSPALELDRSFSFSLLPRRHGWPGWVSAGISLSLRGQAVVNWFPLPAELVRGARALGCFRGAPVPSPPKAGSQRRLQSTGAFLLAAPVPPCTPPGLLQPQAALGLCRLLSSLTILEISGG